MIQRMIPALVCAFAGMAPAADRVTLTGTVTNRDGEPLDEATVPVYRAGVKNG